ncbi:mycothione reductase [Actinophytocola xinjiangensis]|uniref:Mycothione reductase n=1 Tax=Actinophytocola xinjiangensis TaxID=485602 RepID=A0A7Z0WMK0_9PSEU|nr:mycothione reductase [Actinophytocola xinjiangensis]OLF08477.1 mycothione reductase [Actinophytocola xinjiangensis]
MTHFDLVIIGTGSGNSILDKRFAGWRVAIVEKGTFGGVCLNVGCIPTKMFVHTADLASTPASAGKLGVDLELRDVRWAEVRDRIFGRIDPIARGGREYRRTHRDNENVTVFEGTARFTGPRALRVDLADGSTADLTADRVVIAAGSRAVVPDELADAPHHTSDTVMRLDELPRRMTIVGTGFVAAEFAHVFSSFGVDVTILGRSGAMLRHEDADISARFTELARERWDLRASTTATGARAVDGGIRVDLTDGTSLETDLLLVAVGRVPNSDLLDLPAAGVEVDPTGHVVVDDTQATTARGVWALGDVSSHYELKHVANHEARVVQHNLLHPDEPVTADHRFVPHAVFSSPQVASVGLTEEQARAAGVRYVTGTRDYAGIAYGWAMEDTTGFAKVLADPATGLLLGAHIIGPQAATLIQPLIQAMSFGLDARSMARGQYWIHPSVPELIENALLALPLDLPLD